MDLAEAEDRLFDRLCAPGEVSAAHIRALEHTPPKALADYTCIGVDTNIMKRFRRDVSLSERFVLLLAQEKVSIVLPRQCVVEYWNNYKTFANEDWGTYRNDLAKLSKKVQVEGVGGRARELIEQISGLVDELAAELEESKAPDYLLKSRLLVRSLVDSGASVPMVSRPRFADLARIRSQIKSPPGFADEKLKAASHGDFFVWCDFMLGVLCHDGASLSGKEVAWVTEDGKEDWKTGGEGHPALFDEFAGVTEANLSVLSFDQLKTLLDSVETVVAPEPSEEGDDLEPMKSVG